MLLTVTVGTCGGEGRVGGQGLQVHGDVLLRPTGGWVQDFFSLFFLYIPSSLDVSDASALLRRHVNKVVGRRDSVVAHHSHPCTHT